MATSHKDLEGWQVITTDEHGNITTGSRRRSRKGGAIENVYIQRISDGLSFGRGNSVVMHDEVTKTYSIYLIHEIRQNTLNNLIEIWAFSYLRWFELNPTKYYTQFDPLMLKKGLSNEELKDIFFKGINLNEIYLTAELSEIWLKDFIDIANVVTKAEYDKIPKDKLAEDKDFFIRYICEPTAESFVSMDINKEVKRIKMMEPKSSEEHLKKMTVRIEKPSSSTSRKVPSSSAPSSNTHAVTQSRLQLKERLVEPDIKDEWSSSEVPASFILNKTTPPKNSSPTSNSSITQNKPVMGQQQPQQQKLFTEDSDSDSNYPNKNTSLSKSGEIKDKAEANANVDQKLKEEAEKEEKEKEEEEKKEEELTSPSENEEDSFVVADDAELVSDSSSSSSHLPDSEEEERLERVHRKRSALRKELYGPKRKERKLSKNKPQKKVISESDSEEDTPLRKITSQPQPSSPLEKSKSIIPESTHTQGDNSMELATQETKQLSVDLNKLKDKYARLKSKFENNSKDPSQNFSSNISENSNDSNITLKSLDIAALETKIKPTVPNNQRTPTIFSTLKKQKDISDDKSIIQVIQDFVSLPARSKEFARCYLEIFDSLRKNESKALYINGRSGNGKSSIVNRLIHELEKSSDYKELSIFNTAILNRRTMCDSLYKYVWDKLSDHKDEFLSPDAIECSLEFFFASIDKNRKRHSIIVLDDLDLLCNENPNLLFKFFSWTTFPNSKLIVIAVGQNPDLIKQSLGKHVLSKINYHHIPFENYSDKELSKIVEYHLRNLKDNYKYKIYQDTKTLDIIFEKIQINKDEENNNSNNSKSISKVINTYMDDKTITEACKKICLTNNDAGSAVRIIENASDYVIDEYIKEQNIFLKSNKEFSLSDLPNEKEIDLNAILKSLDQTNIIIDDEQYKKLSYIEKLFLFSCSLCVSEKMTYFLETEEIYDKMIQLVNNNKENSFIANILQTLIIDSDNTPRAGAKESHNYSKEIFEVLNWNKIIHHLVSLKFLVVTKEDTKNVNQAKTIKINMPISALFYNSNLSTINV
ncbi:chromatin-silencing protein SIR3 PWA37_002709 [Arxiozyma heterogenica]|uniref:chromatin-silencing protein SIR3 n=1 Tax=Arxiozyma heterogenica TaxID=278026 RepID=UPI002EFB8022